jgi:uncharacterized protein (DUF58 family)
MRWFLGALALLLAALVLESGLLAYSMYVLLGLLLLTRWLARNWVGNLAAERTVRKAGARPVEGETGEDESFGGLALEIGEKVAVQVRVENTGALPVPWVLLEDALPGRSTDLRNPRLKVKGKRLQIGTIRGGGEMLLKYQLECTGRGYHQIGPLVLESGDLFGLHRRFRVLTEPKFVLVYPRIVPLSGYDLASRRPIGDVRMAHRLFEDPTRIAGVRPYQNGDPLSRVHWRATARTGALHSKVHEPSTLSGITVLLDFHESGYHQRGEPYRSELAVTAAVSLAHAVFLMGQQVGLVTNARDAAERIRTEGWDQDPRTRQAARQAALDVPEAKRLEPLVVETRRGAEQLQRIREVLARAEPTSGLSFAQLLVETAHRLPRDATALAVLPEVSVETAISLGNLRRRGMAVAVVLVTMDDTGLERAYARLVAEGIRDLRHLTGEDVLPDLCRSTVSRFSPYDFASLGE